MDSNNGGGGGIGKPWGLVLIFTVLVIVCIPPFLSSLLQTAQASISGTNNGWDTFNFLLVVFAIICGLFSRRRSFSYHNEVVVATTNTSTSRREWPRSCNYNEAQVLDYPLYSSSSSTPTLRMMCSSSYREAQMPAGWRGCEDGDNSNNDGDVQLNWRQFEDKLSFREPETKTITVDTCVLKPRSGSPVSSETVVMSEDNKIEPPEAWPIFSEKSAEDLKDEDYSYPEILKAEDDKKRQKKRGSSIASFYQKTKKGGSKSRRSCDYKPNSLQALLLANAHRKRETAVVQSGTVSSDVAEMAEARVKEETEARVKEETPAAVFCPSPDVNNKAEMFIARFRAGLKLEKLNSIREKVRQGKDFMIDDDS